MATPLALFLQTELAGRDSSHDVDHAHRVQALALRIADSEGVEDQTSLSIIRCAALFHDMIDSKYVTAPLALEQVSQRIREYIKANNLSLTRPHIDFVFYIIENMSYSKETNGLSARSPSGVHEQLLGIVQDADRLDALGAIGIARAFAYGGSHGESMCDCKSPQTSLSSSNTTLGHMQRKLPQLKALMKTKTGAAIAEEREAFVISFMNQFLSEWTDQ